MTVTATAVPAKIASPPNLGIGLVCILLSSLGISITPILGASHTVTGVTTSEMKKAIPNMSQNFIIKGIAVSFSYICTSCCFYAI